MRLGHFFLKLNEYNRQKEQDFRLQAELFRAQTTILANVHIRKQDRMKPEQIWPMPWDEAQQTKKRLDNLTEEELKQAYKQFIEKR